MNDYGMFLGEYRHQLDEKCRLRIPAKFKELLGEHPFITRGANNCLLVLRAEEARIMLEEKFKGIDIMDPIHNKSLRYLTSGAFFADEDKQGRILIPDKLLLHAKLKEKGSENILRNVVTVGMFNRLEIYREDLYEIEEDEEGDSFDENLVKMIEKERQNRS